MTLHNLSKSAKESCLDELWKCPSVASQWLRTPALKNRLHLWMFNFGFGLEFKRNIFTKSGPTCCFKLLQGFQQCLGFKKKTALPKRKNGNSSVGKKLSIFWKNVYSDLSVQEKQTLSIRFGNENDFGIPGDSIIMTFLSPIVGGHVNNLWLWLRVT